jgi:flavin reductase (DIM6/NTAB) family NADH-FMN oxidoreductase RutF
MTSRKPWNRITVPVYSISSQFGDEKNMHIITYVTAISMQPKRFICGIYLGTKTLELVEQSGEFVLQLLADHQVNLVNLLGKQSGNTIDKVARLEKRKELSEWKNYLVLKNALAVMKLSVINRFEAGDHVGFLCKLTDYKNLNEGNTLNLDHLRAKKLIRI